MQRKENSSESPNINVPGAFGRSMTSGHAETYNTCRTERINPAIGPDAPMSTRDFLVVIGDCILINAPKVPKIVGAGIK